MIRNYQHNMHSGPPDFVQMPGSPLIGAWHDSGAYVICRPPNSRNEIGKVKFIFISE